MDCKYEYFNNDVEDENGKLAQSFNFFIFAFSVWEKTPKEMRIL